MSVTIDDLKVIFPSNLSDPQLTVALETAQLIVSEQLQVVGCTMSDARLDKITLYLSAHYAEANANMVDGIPSGGLKRSKLSESDESYFGPSEGVTGYMTSKWGQMAVALDQCGILAATTTNNGLRAEFRVV